MTPFWQRMNSDCRRIDGTSIFAAAATNAFFFLHTGSVFRIGINCVLRTLLFADQAELSLRPSETARVIYDRTPH